MWEIFLYIVKFTVVCGIVYFILVAKDKGGWRD